MHTSLCVLILLKTQQKFVSRRNALKTCIRKVLIVDFVISVHCQPGYYGVENETCLQCPVGTYQPDEGSPGCVKCPYRVSYTEPAAVRESQCVDKCEFRRDFKMVN